MSTTSSEFLQCPCVACAFDYLWGRIPKHTPEVAVTSTQDSAKNTPKSDPNPTKEQLLNPSIGPKDSAKLTSKAVSNPVRHNSSTGVSFTKGSVKPASKGTPNSSRERILNQSTGPHDPAKFIPKGTSNLTKHNSSTGTPHTQALVKPISGDALNPTKERVPDLGTSTRYSAKPFLEIVSNPTEHNKISGTSQNPVEPVPKAILNSTKERELNSNTSAQDPAGLIQKEVQNSTKERASNSSISPKDPVKFVPKEILDCAGELSILNLSTPAQDLIGSVPQNASSSTNEPAPGPTASPKDPAKSAFRDVSSSTNRNPGSTSTPGAQGLVEPVPGTVKNPTKEPAFNPGTGISIVLTQEPVKPDLKKPNPNYQDSQTNIEMAIEGIIDPVTKPTQSECLERLNKHITIEKPKLGEKLLKKVDDYAEVATKMVSALIDAGCDQHEVAMDLSILTLYDLVLLIDDSTSMGSRENIETLKKTLEQILEIYSLANIPKGANATDGIKSVRFINHRQGKGKFKNEHLDEVVNRSSYVGVTRIGTELHRKVLLPFVLGEKLRPVTMTKPLLVMVITDGTVEGEKKGLLEEVIINCISVLKEHRKQGEQAVAFQFVRIGNDPKAKALLRNLDDHPKLGDHIDCLPESIKLEDINNEEWAGKKWQVMPKLLVGAIVPHWDDYDEPLDLGVLADNLDEIAHPTSFGYDEDN